jgi:hypothetical protein
MASLEVKEKQTTSDQQKKPYQKPTLMRQEMFERFALACNKTPSACRAPIKFS